MFDKIEQINKNQKYDKKILKIKTIIISCSYQ